MMGKPSVSFRKARAQKAVLLAHVTVSQLHALTLTARMPGAGFHVRVPET